MKRGEGGEVTKQPEAPRESILAHNNMGLSKMERKRQRKWQRLSKVAIKRQGKQQRLRQNEDRKSILSWG